MLPAHAHPRPTTGSVKLGRVSAGIARYAVAAAALWNTYLPPEGITTMNVLTAPLPGAVVGRIWLPCVNSTCNVTIDPSYAAPFNVLVHEFGHGLNLPRGAVSTRYPQLSVDESNHWSPGSIDPSEIMTAALHPDPYLSKYTLDAMRADHRGCLRHSDCGRLDRCHRSDYERSPGICVNRAGIVNSYSYESWAGSVVVLFIFFICVALVVCAVAPP